MINNIITLIVGNKFNLVIVVSIGKVNNIITLIVGILLYQEECDLIKLWMNLEEWFKNQ